MDVLLYAKLKKAGLVKLVKVGKSHAYELRRFDANFGTELEPEVGAISKQELEMRRTELQGQITALDELIADLPEK